MPCIISIRAKQKINALWLQKWQSSAKSLLNRDLVEAPLGTDILKLHKGLRKAESSLAIQLRTGTNGLDAFLYQARVPSVSSPLCSCRRWRQTAKHVLIFCPKHTGARHELRDKQGGLPDSSKLLGTAEGLRKTTKWVMQKEILGQFRGAKDVLYGYPFAPSFVPDWCSHSYGALETTGNLIDKLLAWGEGFYSRKGFPCPTHITSRSSAWATSKLV